MNKWGKKYWADLAERVGSTAIYGAITLLTTMQLTDIDAAAGWAIVGLPTALSALKGLASNMGSPDGPTASLVDVTSTGSDDSISATFNK